MKNELQTHPQFLGLSNLSNPRTCQHSVLISSGRTNGGQCLDCKQWVYHNSDTQKVFHVKHRLS